MEAKTPRKRVANFTTDEKALLAQIIKNKPIIESKLTDGKSIAKKHAAWELVTREFNCHANVTKRENNTLKRAWDNMKAWTRKTRATERGNLIRTGGGPQQPPPPTEHGAIINMVEDAAPVIICEVKNPFDSDGAILSAISSQEVDRLTNDSSQQSLIANSFGIKLIDSDILSEEEKLDPELTFNVLDTPQIEDHINIEPTSKKYCTAINTQVRSRKPADYIRREAVLRIKHLENKKKVETQILKTQLELEEIKKRAALFEEERNKILLEKATIELGLLKNQCNKATNKDL